MALKRNPVKSYGSGLEPSSGMQSAEQNSHAEAETVVSSGQEDEPAQFVEKKRRRRGDDVRERVLAAALQCFGAFGFEGTSTRDVAARADLKSDLLKELERQIGIYDRYQNVAGIDEARLKRVLRNLQELRQKLFAVGSQFLQPIRDSEFLAGVKHRRPLPGGTC